ncbi:MAG TPA: TauD/TfdA family dioxygenase [Rhodopila sp.]|uniref:TauD/TfdA family dioxygenase n=1 Tax=Rhodopila sp. TaxID=2480087 RepID=UPI002CEB3B10|nr:TauD/TfdA family dioxygenase [Rhodopila sp.]HVY18212.1 TauD/TfdA family dioxygenase [Rhodopila sp.]
MEYAPIKTTAAWEAREVGDRWLRILAAEEQDALAAMLDVVKASGKPMLALTRHDVPLGAFAPVIRELRDQLEDGIGFMTLRGVPSDRFSVEDNRLLFWALATHLGVARPQGKASQLMSDVRADGGTYRAVGGRGYNTNAELDYHADGTDWVGLYCLQVARSGGLSRLASTAAIHNEILKREPALLNRLYQPFPYNRQNEEAADEAPWYWAPVFSLAEGQFASRYIRNHVRSGQTRDDVPRLEPEGHRALDIIQDLAETDRFRFDMVLERGDMQWVNNHVLIHSRTQFEDHDDPKLKRHLLRLWLSVPNARPLCEGLRDAYKAVETNTVRGGFQGLRITAEIVAYQARAAQALGMRDTPYRVPAEG